MYDFGLRLKTLRMQKGWSQRELAKRLNKSPSAVSNYESNTQIPPWDVAVSLANTLGVSLDYLAGFEETPLYLSSGLSQQQKEVIALLVEEFRNPTNNSPCLSEAQLRIIQKEIELFTLK